jgi:signal transduction histidine kinase
VELSRTYIALAQAICTAEETSDVNVRREPILRVLFSFFPSPDVVVGLWLIDTDGRGDRYEATLWQVVRTENDATPSREYKSARIPVHAELLAKSFDLRDQATIRDTFKISLREPSVADQLVGSGAHGGSQVPLDEVLAPLVTREEGDVIGLLQIVAPADAVREVKDRYLAELAAVVDTIAASIVTGRRQRLTSALTEFQTSLPNAKTSADLAKALSAVLLKYCNALSCAIYRPIKSDVLECLADTTIEGLKESTSLRRGSFSFAMLERTAETDDGLLYFSDLTATPGDWASEKATSRLASELVRNFGPHVTSWLSYAVRGNTGAEGNGTVPILYIRLLTAPHESFLGGTFSKTAREMLQKLGIYVTELFSSLFLNEAITQVAAGASALRSKISTHFAQPELLLLEREYGKLIMNTINSVKQVYIAQRYNALPQETIRDCDGEVIDGLTHFSWDFAAEMGDHKEQLLSYHSLSTKEIDIPLYSPGEFDYGLRCVLAGRPFALYEWRVLGIIVGDLRLAELESLDFARKAREIAELRHTLRATLGGVRDHVNVLKDAYDVGLQAHRAGDDQTAIRQIFETAKFRKTLYRAFHSSELLNNQFANIQISMRDLTADALKRTDVNVSSLLKNLHIPFLPELERRRLRYINKTDEDAIAFCDEWLVQTTLFNLLDNAVKYSYPDNSITVAAADYGSYILITVENVGPQIEAKRQSEIFQPLNRFRGAEHSAGTGLGLAISKKIVDAHGGQITVKSQPFSTDGEGRAVTTFAVRLFRR